MPTTQHVYVIECPEGPQQPVTAEEFRSLIERGQVTIMAKHGREKLLAAISEYHSSKPQPKKSNDAGSAAIESFVDTH